MASISDTHTSRVSRLNALFDSIINGTRTISSAREGQLFIEAICQKTDRKDCIERVAASQSAMDAFSAAVRFDTSIGFINGNFSRLVAYLQEAELNQLCGGEILRRLLVAIVDPPILWNAFVGFQKAKELSGEAERAFAWLLLELLSWTSSPVNIFPIAEDVLSRGGLTESSSHDARVLASRLTQVVNARRSDIAIPEWTGAGPGGRHDNDFADFRSIAIYPTNGELESKEKPYYRRADSIEDAPLERRVAMHLDNQYRLGREDMLAELRDDLKALQGSQGRRRNIRLSGIRLAGMYMRTPTRRTPFGLLVTCDAGLERLTELKSADRKDFLDREKRFLKHNSFGCLMENNRVIAFATVERVEDKLLKDPPQVTLRIRDPRALEAVLLRLKDQKSEIDFFVVDTAMFAYEPILECLKRMVEIPLAREILGHGGDETGEDECQGAVLSPICPTSIADSIEQSKGQDLHEILDLPKQVDLDPSQLESLLSGLRQTVSLIQGPPGTGKSFIGALIAKAFQKHTSCRILVICFTNHALDQYLEDLMDIGISDDMMVRLGSKASSRTEHLNLNVLSSGARRSQAAWAMVNKLRNEVGDSEELLKKVMASYKNSDTSLEGLFGFLEFEDSLFYEAFQVPSEDEGFVTVDEKGQEVSKSYLFDRWRRNLDAGIFKDRKSQAEVWGLDQKDRESKMDEWRNQLIAEAITTIVQTVKSYDTSQSRLKKAIDEQKAELLRSKRIVACTTTGAAMHAELLQNASPELVLVEEAGEILESHVLTALTPATKQLVLIGDHKQLRPKVNNFALTVEKGDGYDLNRSLFERLILGGFPHTTLASQHRMHPEISQLVRHLTYPKLRDAPKTQNRPPLRGLQDRVIFFNHDHLENSEERTADRRDEGSSVSRKNDYEADMVLQIVRYLGQQGYGTGEQVVLTPYLGQLALLRKKLSQERDPVLNDLDSFDLVRAGLLPPESAAHDKKKIKLSTVDNYQGEECDIVIVSLTRANSKGDIGFMKSPERLNVLLSRARDGLILIGNYETFLNSKKGKETWGPFLDLMSKKGHIYNGFPVKCEQHPDMKMVLKQKSDFAEHCPDGGCAEPCGTMLQCGVHECPQRCHQLSDHTKMECNKMMSDICVRKHKLTWRCHNGRPASCKQCDFEIQEKERKVQRDLELDLKRQQRQRDYARRLANLQDEIVHEQRLQRDQKEEFERQKVLRQLDRDLKGLKKNGGQRSTKLESADPTAAPGQRPASPPAVPNLPTNSAANPPSADNQISGPSPQPDSPPSHPAAGPQSDSVKRRDSQQDSDQGLGKGEWKLTPSAAKADWDHLKQFEGASNEALDELMDMIGLENLKEEFLAIKTKIDTAVRQGVEMNKERFGTALLGNPGTGKTTVARIYAKFLCSVGALPGNFFVESSGSDLANDGVPGCKKKIEEILNNGGGAMFIDEAYQLASGNNAGGKNVLDFLLAEVENLRGKVVFILAGYNKQMEGFFAHNPGIPSRFPKQLQFQDYKDEELLEILNYGVEKRWNGRMRVELGIRGLYGRIVARRVGRGRDREGFGNARQVENTLAQISDRQAKRLRRERKAGNTPDDLLLTKEDMLGPEPADVLKDNAAWKKIQQLIGLGSVKDSVKSLFDSIQYNYTRELDEEPLVEFSLNKVFLGNPGTGKTTVAKLYGQVLADIAFLSSGEVVVKTPADFVGSVLGGSEAQTKGILAATVGKVLVIDEAYGLFGGTSGAGGSSDTYKTAVIDTIVAEVQSVPGDDRCVLLLGYREQMEEMFQNVNPGLTRSFPIDSAFNFDDFDDDELASIFDLKLKLQSFKVTDQARKVALGMLSRARIRPHFGNAGEIDIILNDAKMRHQKRISKGKGMITATFEAEDFDPDFDMGFLSAADVKEVSATELIGQYIGHTGPKVQKLFENSLGKVLFIDEAYRLGEGHFAKEAIDEMVDCLTKPQFAQKLVVILAGYTEDINRLMAVNPGLTSRFPETITFESITPEESLDLLTSWLKKKKVLELSVIDPPSDAFRSKLLELFATLRSLPNWASVRDIQTIGKAVFGKILKSGKPTKDARRVSESDIVVEMERMVRERAQRGMPARPAPASLDQLPTISLDPPTERPPAISSAPPPAVANEAVESQPEQPRAEQEQAETEVDNMQKDAGVSDAVWHQLQEDARNAEAAEQEYQSTVDRERALEEQQREEEKKAKESEAPSDKDSDDDDDDSKKERERKRLQKIQEERLLKAEMEKVRIKKIEMERERRKEAKARQALRQMGVCPVGFKWIKQAGGYRCAGGSHFVSEAQILAHCS
ncbi:P-loop containing nucleoside triphosphate hydrolase protein [Phyllosticta capitalensis]